MAKKRKDESTPEISDIVDMPSETIIEVKEKETPRPAPQLPKRRPKPQPVFSFDRYFATLGKPAHWKAGMRAFLRTKDLRSKKTVAEWDRLFTNY